MRLGSVCRSTFRSTILIATFMATSAAADEDPCGGFKLDLADERALFAGTAESLPAGSGAAPAPPLVPGRLYRLQLSPQSGVIFAAAPGKATPPEGSFAGLATFDIDRAGLYRVAVDQPLWIDVAGSAKLAPVQDFQGQHSCDAPRKVVAFELTGATHWTLQLSGAAGPAVKVTLTRVPPDRTH